jgi:hypothetical protein
MYAAVSLFSVQSWAAVPAGVATGVVLAGYLGRRATRRLETRQAGVLKLLADAAR